jgi:NAD(P)-dependent dehydrogenase (short-subunit alcohol dehydrogenase family)
MIEDQVALVTGGGRGIGSALAHALADAGAKVAILARSSDEVMRTVDAIVSRGGCALGLVADVTDRASIERSVQEARVALGHIDLLINNAGISDPRGEFWELDIDD